jgi:hypothetical protein
MGEIENPAHGEDENEPDGDEGIDSSSCQGED